MSRLVLLVTSPRVAPGLLSAAAWDVLRSGRVLAGSDATQLAAALSAAGMQVEVAAPDVRALLSLARSESRPVVWLVSAAGDVALTDGLTAAAVAASSAGEPLPEVEVVHGSYDLPGARFLDLVALMDRLRSPGGCPWDAKQTHASLVTYLVEETYETIEAIETGDDVHLREELGDLLLQVVFHARIAEERASEPWSVDDVAGGIVDKLVRRHPHVFGHGEAPDLETLDASWEQQKTAEKGRVSSMEGVPLALPALSLAAKLLHRAEKAGVPVDVPAVDFEGDIGDALLGLVVAARARGVDAEQELRSAVRRFADAVRVAEGEP